MNLKTSIFRDSARELTKVSSLTACSMLAAMAVVLKMTTSVTLGPFIRIGFYDIPAQIAYMLFGPVTGSLFGGLLDLVEFFVKPEGAYFFGFTFDKMLAGFLFGMFYYKKKLTFPRILLAEGVERGIVNLFFNTLWLSVLYGKGFLALLPERVLSNVISWPLYSILFFCVVRAIESTGVFSRFRNASMISGRK